MTSRYSLRNLTELVPSEIYGINNAGTSSLELNYDQGLTMNVNETGGISIQDLNGNSITTTNPFNNLTIQSINSVEELVNFYGHDDMFERYRIKIYGK